MPAHFPLLSRRRFLALGACTALASSTSAIESTTTTRVTGTLRVHDHQALSTMPLNFSGLSYESAQLANPYFFSGHNHELIRLFRRLSPQGVLRIGGGTSSYTVFSARPFTPPPPFEVFGPDTSKTAKEAFRISTLALENLRSFLNATHWACLYGLNLGQGSKANAIAEAEAVFHILGPRLLAFQIGNEPDTFRHFRPQGYSRQDFVREWISFHDAIAARLPQARFAGPDISNNLSYLTAFAKIAPHYPDIVLLTMHYYAMGPAGNPKATLSNLLSPNPQLTTLKWSRLPTILSAMHKSHMPCRISEVNSCWNGGEPGVSNVFGSALWCSDMMLHFASLGFAGVNLHGGGYGWYSPITGSPSRGFSVCPEFYGIEFAQHLAGATLLKTTLYCSSDRVSAYAGCGPGSRRQIAIINKTIEPASLRLTGSWSAVRHWETMELTAPSLHATQNILFRRSRVTLRNGEINLSPHSALLLLR